MQRERVQRQPERRRQRGHAHQPHAQRNGPIAPPRAIGGVLSLQHRIGRRRWLGLRRRLDASWRLVLQRRLVLDRRLALRLLLVLRHHQHRQARFGLGLQPGIGILRRGVLGERIGRLLVVAQPIVGLGQVVEQRRHRLHLVRALEQVYRVLVLARVVGLRGIGGQLLDRVALVGMRVHRDDEQKRCGETSHPVERMAAEPCMSMYWADGCRRQNRPTPDGGWLATHQDVTDLRQAERQLIVTKKRCRNMAAREAHRATPGCLMLSRSCRKALCCSMRRIDSSSGTGTMPIWQHQDQAPACASKSCCAQK